MQEEKQPTPIVIEENPINIREELEKYIYYWKWVLLSLLVSLVLAHLYIRYSHPTYSASISVLIKEGSKSKSSGLSGFGDLSIIMGKSNSVNNELVLFKSRTNLINVIKNLNLDVKYFSEGNILTTESYKTTPIKALFIDGNSKDGEVKKSKLSKFIVKGISSEEFQLLDINKKDLGNFRYNDTISKYNICIQPSINKSHENIINKEIIVKKLSLIPLASSYQNRLKIENVKGTSILKMTLNDRVRNKAIDILNELVIVYNKEDLKDSNQALIHTDSFINKRLEKIKIELDEVEKDAEKFKQENRLVDITSEGDLSLQGSNEYNKMIAQVETEISVLNFLKEELNNNQSDFLPEIVDGSDTKTSMLISSYNELMFKKNRLLKSSTEKNPSIININNDLITIKNSIITNISNLDSSLSLRKKGLESEGNKYKGRLSSIPKYENVFRGIQRQQQIKETLYLYLLQKREETALAISATEVTTKVIDSAYGNFNSISPKKRIIYLGALVLGLLLPVVFLYIKFLLDNRLQSRKDIEKVMKIPILGEVPKSKSNKKVVVSEYDRDATAESFRLLRTNIDFMLSKVEEKSRVIYVSSTLSGEGKTFISINLASVLSLTDKKVLLIGADIRKPKITDYLDLKDSKGLTHFLMDASLKASDLVVRVDEYHFDMLHSGIIAPNPSELLMNGRFKDVIEYGKANYDYVIVDTAPVNLVTDTLLLSDHADLFIYVTRAGYLDKRLLEIPKKLYEDKRLPNMAILLNDTNSEKGYGYGYGYGYGGYGESEQKKKWWQIFSKN